MASKRLRFSRWRRLPQGLHRSGERRGPGPNDDLARLSVYLPGHVLDQAQELATHAGVESVQTYCERLLLEAIAVAAAKQRLAGSEAARNVLASIEALAVDMHGPGDPPPVVRISPRPTLVYVARREEPIDPDSNESDDLEDDLLETGAAGIAPVARDDADRRPASVVEPATPVDAAMPPASDREPRSGFDAETGAVLRHAGLLGDLSDGVLPRLRRGETVPAEVAGDLLRALSALETRWRDSNSIDRRVAFALHRLAFEGQLLVSEGWPALAGDPGTIGYLRQIQEAVDRVLSGEDIRYRGNGLDEVGSP